MLKSKSTHEVRGIAQSFNIPDIFSKTKEQLIQEIELKQRDMIPQPDIIPSRPEYDARLMTKPPAKRGSEQEIRDLLDAHMQRGLILTFPEPEIWAMSCGKKNDTGTMRQPLRTILQCAERVMK